MPKQRPYDEAQVAEVCRLLAAGYSQREISIQTGLSRWSISLIAREDFPKRHPAAAKGNRCPTCGGKLTLKFCVYCRVMAWLVARKPLSRIDP